MTAAPLPSGCAVLPGGLHALTYRHVADTAPEMPARLADVLAELVGTGTPGPRTSPPPRTSHLTAIPGGLMTDPPDDVLEHARRELCPQCSVWPGKPCATDDGSMHPPRIALGIRMAAAVRSAHDARSRRRGLMDRAPRLDRRDRPAVGRDRGSFLDGRFSAVTRHRS